MNDRQQLAAMGDHMREMAECKQEFKVPDGWKLVPVDPTIDMPHVVIGHGHFSSIQPEIARKYYRAMLAAAPEYKP